MNSPKPKKTQPPPPALITVTITTQQGRKAPKIQRIQWEGPFEVLIQPIERAA